MRLSKTSQNLEFLSSVYFLQGWEGLRNRKMSSAQQETRVGKKPWFKVISYDNWNRIKLPTGGFPGDPVVKIPPFQGRERGFDPWAEKKKKRSLGRTKNSHDQTQPKYFPIGETATSKQRSTRQVLKGTVCSHMTVTTRLIYPLSLSPVWTTVCRQVSLPLSCRTCYIMCRPRARGNFRAPYLKNIMNSKMTAAEH